MSDTKPIVCVDLDGVLNQFDGWKSAEHFHLPRPGAREFLEQLNQRGYEVIVFTVRWGPHVGQWLAEHDLARYVSRVTNEKPPAHVFIDDRAICFQGDFQGMLEQIANFKAHWERASG